VKPELAKEDGLIRQRYVDVDLVPVDATVPLGGSAKRLGPWIGGGIAALVALLAGMVLLFKNRKVHHHDGPTLLPLPAHLNAVSVIGFLRRIQERDSVTPAMKEAIEKEITALESKHFGREDAPQDPVVLEEIAKRWQAAEPPGPPVCDLQSDSQPSPPLQVRITPTRNPSAKQSRDGWSRKINGRQQLRRDESKMFVTVHQHHPVNGGGRRDHRVGRGKPLGCASSQSDGLIDHGLVHRKNRIEQGQDDLPFLLEGSLPSEAF
jgi:hypothetical protein